MSPSNFSAEKFIEQSLQKREEQNALRKLVNHNQLIDFCSNDYLGFAHSQELKLSIQNTFNTFPDALNGSTGSRLLAGNSSFAETLEKTVAGFHNAQAGLLFNSGYDANVGLFSAIGQKDSTIVYDELIHASVHDGIKMSAATAFMFRHNDLAHLEERLKIAQGIIYVAVESIYSMDGDEAKLKAIAALCKQYKANLIVDEAHATGITSNAGKGLVQKLGLETEVFARVHTFGKALGCHGAIVLGSELLRTYLINFSRAFIYTTALPLHSLVSIQEAYRLLQKNEGTIEALHGLIRLFKTEMVKNNGVQLIESSSPIQCIVVSGNHAVKKMASDLQNGGFDVRPILSPTVPKGKERLRICIHAFNSSDQVSRLAACINEHLLTING